MRKTKPWLMTIAVLLCSVATSAHDFEVGGIYYNITSSTDMTAQVTYRGGSASSYSDEYSGAVTIPSTVTYNSKSYSVTSIGGSAFKGCSSLTSITLPESVTSIGYSAFYECRSLTSVNIPEGVTTIGRETFYDCRCLTSVVIPDNVTSIGSEAFCRCYSLTSITLPKKIATINVLMFASCSRLASVTIPEGVKTIGAGAFSECSSLASITIPESVVSIDDGAFYNCGLTSINIPEGVTTIGSEAFYNCYFTSITCNASVPPIINYDTFDQVRKYTVYVPASSVAAYKSADYWNGFTEIISIPILASGTCGDNLTWELRASGELIIDGIGAMSNYRAGEFAWDDFRESIKTITIKNGVSSIGNNAFYEFSNLTSISIPKTVTSIGGAAFYRCYNLVSITIPNSVTSIGDYAFQECVGLTSLNIPESVTSIGEAAFHYCSRLSSISISKSVVWVGSSAFLSTAWYENLSNGIVYIGKVLYRYKGVSPSNIEINEGVVSISPGAFSGSASLVSISIPVSLTSIGYNAFESCSKLSSVIIPSNSKLTTIGESAFAKCSSLTSFIFPDSVIDIGNGAFASCSSFTEITLPKNIVSIGSWVFNKCNRIISITIPKNITNIGYGAFANCSSLADVYFYSNPYYIYDHTSNSFPDQTTKHLILTDSNMLDFDASNTNAYADVVYNRELAAGKYGTIMLPFAPDAESLENFAFFALSSNNGEYLLFDEVAEPQANTPYLYTLREGKEATQITGGETTISSEIVTPEVDGWKTVGSFTNQTIMTEEDTDNKYYAYTSADNQLHRVTKTLNVKPYRAYFMADGNQPAQLAVRTHNGETTIIDAAEVEDLIPAVYYDLNGRRIDNPTKGVYIVNGKKVIL